MTSTVAALPGRSARFERLDLRCGLCKGISTQESLSVFWDREAFFAWSAFAKLGSREVEKATAEKTLPAAFPWMTVRILGVRAVSRRAFSLCRNAVSKAGSVCCSTCNAALPPFSKSSSCPSSGLFYLLLPVPWGASSCFLNGSIQITYEKKKQRAGERKVGGAVNGGRKEDSGTGRFSWRVSYK